MKEKILGIAIAFAMVATAFAAFPAAAADAQSCRSRVWDYAAAEDSQYHDLAGNEGCCRGCSPSHRGWLGRTTGPLGNQEDLRIRPRVEHGDVWIPVRQAVILPSRRA